MLEKILSLIKKKFRKISSENACAGTHLLDDPIVQFTMQIDDKGDFAISSECYSTELEHSELLGQLLFLANSGGLSDYFVEALRLESESDEEKLKFCSLALEYWALHFDAQLEAGRDFSKDAVDPKDVFSFYKMRP